MKAHLRSVLGHDLFSSVVVFLVALPLCLGIAIASGVPPAAGLITGIIGGIVVGALSGAPLQVSGPAAGLTVIVWDIIQQHGISGLGPILIVAGLLQMAAGFLRVGQWFRAISPAVVFGMLAGIGVLILAGQFHVMVDDKPRANGLQNLLSIPESLVKGFTPDLGKAHNEAAALGVLTIAILILWPKLIPAKFRLIPGALVAIFAASGLAFFLELPVQYVRIPANLTEAISLPTGAGLASLFNAGMLLTAAALAFVASAETLLSAAAVDRMHSGPRAHFDKELKAQGIGNLLCGVLGALPMTGVIVRSSANVQAGARTRASAIMHGFWLLAAVAAVPAMLRLIPVSALAGLLVYTGFKLIDFKNIRQLRTYGRVPVLIYAVTLTAIVVTDLLTGVLIGIALTVVKILYNLTHLTTQLVEREDGRADLYLEGAATFMKLPRLAGILDRVPTTVELHIHCDRLVYIDHTCLDLLRNWHDQQGNAGRPVVLEWDQLEACYERGVAEKKPLTASPSEREEPVTTAR